MEPVAPNLWVIRYPFDLLGVKLGRNVALIRLANGKMLIHTSAPFSNRDVEEIGALGDPTWLIDATLFHDTHAIHGRAAFPRITYYAPEGFAPTRKLNVQPLPPSELPWQEEVLVLELQGMPKVREHVFLHQPSRTLIVSDLVFNIGNAVPAWTRFFMRRIIGIKSYPGMSRLFRSMITDRQRFQDSLKTMFEWDFDRVIVGHGTVISSDGKRALQEALRCFGY